MKKFLSPIESEAIDLLISVLVKYNESAPIKTKPLLAELNAKFSIPNYFVDTRLRMFCNYLRTNAILPLMSTSKGYFVTENPAIILNQIKSLVGRADSIDSCAEGLKVFYKKYTS